MPGVHLDISIVTYAPDLVRLDATLRTLVASFEHAQRTGRLGTADLWLVHNGPDTVDPEGLKQMLETHGAGIPGLRCHWLTGHGNVGYGVGHNQAIVQGDGVYHLVLNPDVECEPEALTAAIDYMNQHPDVGLLSPYSSDAHGHRQYLAKRYPALFDLVIRGFAPTWVRRIFRARLARYEMQDAARRGTEHDALIVSGCFMFFRRAVLDRLNGFSRDYFLYFEDFDISLRVSRVARVVHVPGVRIVHHGGHAARKGWRHIRLFVTSMARFYRSHGLKLL